MCIRDRTWPLRPGTVVAPSVSYQYDAVGNRTKLTTANQIIDYTFDDLNRLHLSLIHI